MTHFIDTSGLTSFELMRRLGLARAFSFDRRFAEQGLTCLP